MDPADDRRHSPPPELPADLVRPPSLLGVRRHRDQAVLPVEIHGLVVLVDDLDLPVRRGEGSQGQQGQAEAGIRPAEALVVDELAQNPGELRVGSLRALGVDEGDPFQRGKLSSLTGILLPDTASNSKRTARTSPSTFVTTVAVRSDVILS